ncbi:MULTISPECIES: alpha/beta hydrolase fold domain-containing protein [unclassified Microbacterium]|uniref:alpha/beta hydrolase fold domain-containing protein n=1 Tax=unclassified Microbacterium TaxID=2609290 RepID=UPI00301045B2
MTAVHDLDLHPAIRAWGERIAEHSAAFPELAGRAAAPRRAAALRVSDLVAAEFTLPAPDDVAIDEVAIDGPDGTLRLRRFRPAGIADLAPTQLFLHGGGFFGGTVDEILNDRLCARRARDARIQIASLEYRLAPEHRYPAAAEDAMAALTALASDPALGADPARLGIGGNSAGAAIAASAVILLRDRARRGETVPPVLHQDLEVLPAALRLVGSSGERYADGFGLDDAAELVEVYVGPGEPPYAAAPLDVPDLTGLPPALLMVAEFDPLRDSGIRYGERLRAAGVPATVIVGEGHLHGTPGITAALPAARDWQDRHSRALATAYGTAPHEDSEPAAPAG